MFRGYPYYRRHPAGYFLWRNYAEGAWTVSPLPGVLGALFWSGPQNGPAGVYDPMGDADGNLTVTAT